ncbi:MAG: PAS domain-containing protein [Acidobacteria bacterium]|nr:PAS domain-containing protein [Acidobacteriota bacterium]
MHETSAGREFPAPHGRILIVDADPGAREMLSRAVTGLGHTVCHAAEPGPAAIDVPGAARPDVALIGLAAGEQAGLAVQTGERIAKRFGVPLVYATETTDAESLDQAQRTDPHGYVLKAGDPRQLGLVIRAALRATVRKSSDGQEANPDDMAPRPEWNSAILEGLFDNMSDAVIVADARGRFVAVNAAARRLSGTYDPSNPEQWSQHFEVYEADGRTPFATEDLPLTAAIRGESTGDALLRLRPRHAGAGTEDLWLRASGYPLRDAGGRCLGGTVVLRDVTAGPAQSARAKRIEAELHERVQVLDAIIRSMGDGVVVADAQARFTLFNPSAERIVGIGMTDRPPDEWTDLYGVFYADGVTPVPTDQLPVVRAVQGETVEALQLFVRNSRVPDGVYISVNASPVRSESGVVVGGVAVFRDVTQRRMEQEALTQAFAHGRLEVIDTVLHNIGNAINSVATGVDTLNGWFQDNELMRRFGKLADLVAAHDHDWISWLEHDAQGRQIRPFLLALVRDLTGEHEKLVGTAARVRERVRHIVDIIRTQASFTNSTVERKLVDLRATIRDAVKVVQESLGQRGVTIEVDCARAPHQILVQESRFQQMLVNLLKNAMEATDERAARPEDAPGWRPRIRVLAYRGEQKNTLVIDVGDNGIGIDPSHFGSVFNAGYTTKQDGTGLGLHSAANFVIGSGGSIQPLSDGIGHGATLRVTLRLVEEPRPQRSLVGRSE